MLNEIFKNGVAWFIGATVSGVASVLLIFDYIKRFFD